MGESDLKPSQLLNELPSNVIYFVSNDKYHLNDKQGKKKKSKAKKFKERLNPNISLKQFKLNFEKLESEVKEHRLKKVLKKITRRRK